MNKKYLSISACSLLATVILSGCGGSSGSSSVSTGTSTSILSMNPNLANIDYNCGQGLKQTTSTGEFNYNAGDECKFYVGGLELKVTPNSNEISTQKLADANSSVTRKALDDYFYASGGTVVNDVLTIPSSYKAETKSIVDFSTSEKVISAISSNTNMSSTKKKEYLENIAKSNFDKQIEFANRLDISFKTIATPLTEVAMNTQQASPKAYVNGSEQTIGYATIMKTGNADNSEIFGLVKDYQDKPIQFDDSSNYICNGTNSGVGSGLDYSSFLNINDKLYMVSQFECQIGAMYMTELEQDSTTGALTPKSGTLKYISQKDEFGGFVHCAGMKTPWESHLGSEEYENDAKTVENSVDSNGITGNKYYDETAKFWGGDATKMSPYYYGWTPEVKIDTQGNANYSKHYSMGRFSHEISYVMPDNKTVYLSDDGTNVGLFMYIADNPTDLSAGTLYAAKWNQTSNEKAGSADLTWINLGHATDSEIKTILDPDNDVTTNDAPVFSDIFDIATGTNGTCSDGYKSVNTSAGHECLKLKTGMEKAASRLEARRYAAYLGATTEFRKEEGITFDKNSGRLYVSMSEVRKGMEDDSSYDLGGNNDIKLTANKCGAVYALDLAESTVKDTSTNDISSNYVVSNMYSIIEGTPMKYADDSIYAGNSCDVNGISNPDNITYLPNSDILTIGEDTGSHKNNVVWSYNTKTNELTRLFTSPVGAETTSTYWYTNLANGFGYLSVVTQHPDQATTDAGESVIGYVGPFKNLSTIKSIKKVGSYNTSKAAGSEIVAYDKASKKMFTTNGADNTLDISTINSDGSVTFSNAIDLSTYADGVNSVAVKNGMVAVAMYNKAINGIQQKGVVVIFDTNGTHQTTVNAGYLPDMVTFNKDGSLIIVANEGEPSSDYSHDPKGSVGVINVGTKTYTDLTFDGIDIPQDVVIKAGAVAANDIEPEYITVSGTKAYVTLQENNAIAIVDLTTPKIDSVVALGFKDYSKPENAIDIQENGKIELKTFSQLYGMYMPDSIASYTVDGNTYLVTANEGDGRDYGAYANETKIKKLTLDPSISADYADDNDLKVNNEMGKNLDGEYEKLYTFGARSFSIWDSNGVLVLDSKNELSKLTAKFMPTLFNQDEGEMDKRSGNKGVEPEALTVGTIDGKTYAFVGLERQSAIVVYDITTPTSAKFVKYLIMDSNYDISPEGMKFVDSSNSSTGKPLLLVAYEGTGSTAVYEIEMDSTKGAPISIK